MTSPGNLEVEMTNSTESASAVELLAAVCRELIRIAKREEDMACDEAARTPYWSPCPPTVEAHRAAARALREDAARLEAEARSLSLAS
jgi:hypothetical protein